MDGTPKKFTPIDPLEKAVTGEFVTLFGESFYKIRHFDLMKPFFMSLVSSSDHWLFISSTGGLSAGRVNAQQALFPYYTEDKLAENSDNTGSKTILRVNRGGQIWLWEPFSDRQFGQYAIERNLYKNSSGTALIFEEINHSLGVNYRYAWRTGDQFGFVKTAWLQNMSDSSAACQVDLLDGLQNILPANVSSATQNIFSCLLDAYKRSELDGETSLGILALNSTLTDLAEPSESLLATTVFQVGFAQPDILLSALQIDRFRAGKPIAPEAEIRGNRGAYFVHASLHLPAGSEAAWHIVANTQQDAADIANLRRLLKGNQIDLRRQIEQDLAANTAQLRQIVGSADGLQVCANPCQTTHHFANVMFNVMRGGIFANQYWIDKADFTDHISTHHTRVLQDQADFLIALPGKIHLSDLLNRAGSQASADLARLCYTYLPLTFSRRHGDPSRPWNQFAINIRKADGSQRLDYEGNWRDIFQNWEALVYSFPEYVESMIVTFLCATTADGYNPYRITRAGLDWEVPEPGNPWANIGYWSDHQIIYLQKLIEISEKVHPGRLSSLLGSPILSYANVPYRIKPYADLLKDPYSTIQFDRELEDQIQAQVRAFGTDGKLLLDAHGQVLHRSLAEKLLTLLLAKLVNFVPEGGIWMNTQRPEWNDANNALVGKGLSVVTLCYLRRFIVFCRELFSQLAQARLSMSAEVADLFARVLAILKHYQANLAGSFNDEQRRSMMDALGQAGSDYRWMVYPHGFSGEMAAPLRDDLLAFLELAQRYVEHSLRANQRPDLLYHTYNILHLGDKTASIGRLVQMLEGQVAILSSGLLSGDESLRLLENLRKSALYRADQHTYILYPDKELPGFLAKNTLTMEQVGNLQLPVALAERGDKTLFVRDLDGRYHFSGQLRNAKNVRQALQALADQPLFSAMVVAEGDRVLALFEEVFHHTEFTGRSGTFFAYEGLGSIYWHMISKLLLAVQETTLRCQDEPAVTGLVEKYHELCAGLGFNKTPAVFGAFPTDPYSHTPKDQGARQPGMTGMVKEEILTRQAEVGLVIDRGCLTFNALLLDPKELISTPAVFEYQDVAGEWQRIELPAVSLAFTICQVPVVIQEAETPGIEIHLTDGCARSVSGNCLDAATSEHIFRRAGVVHHLVVHMATPEPPLAP